MPALTQHSTSITLFRISAAMFLNYLTIGIPLVMLPLYVQQQLHLSDLLIGIAVGSQFIATLLTGAPRVEKPTRQADVGRLSPVSSTAPHQVC